MDKIAFVFSGQGAQYTGMGKSLSEASDAAKEIFNTADTVRPNTSDLCYDGTKEELMITSNTQPCVFAVDLAAANALKAAGVTPDAVAGFSLGELAAITFAGVFSNEDGFRLVCHRAELMQTAAEKTDGVMVAVLKLDNETVEDLCRKFDGFYPVNYNCKGQLTVAGKKENIKEFCEAVTSLKGRAIPVAVGGGFHSPYMQTAAAGFAEVLGEYEPKKAQMPVYANKTALVYTQEDLKSCLAEQIQSPVLWQKTIENMANDGINTFIEVGPGKTLSGLIRRILPSANVCNVEDETSLKNTLERIL